MAADSDITGNYAIDASSKVSPACRGAGEIQIIQAGTAITGVGSISGNCIGGPYLGEVTGTYDGFELKLTFFSDFSYSFYTRSEDISRDIINGAYGSVQASDSGSATLTRID